jgi:hypothetical protein
MAAISTEKEGLNTAAAVLKKNAAAKAVCARLFSTADGEVVYAWLMNQFYHNQHIASDEAKLSRHAGRRDVMVLLRGIVEK